MAIDPVIEKLKQSRRDSIRSVKAAIEEAERSSELYPSLKQVLLGANKARRARLASLERELKLIESAQPELPGVPKGK